MAGKKKIKEEIKLDTKIIDILNYSKKEGKVVEYDIGTEVISVKISESIPLDEAYDFVNVVVDNCFIDGTYSPIYKNISIARALIAYFTDLDMPEDFEYVYKALNETTLIEDIRKYVSTFQLYDILSSIDELISFNKEKMFKNSEFETMMVDLGNLISLGLEKLSALDLTRVNFEKINSLVDGIVEQVNVEKEKI
jgi:hypothetical protein